MPPRFPRCAKFSSPTVTFTRLSTPRPGRFTRRSFTCSTDGASRRVVARGSSAYHAAAALSKMSISAQRRFLNMEEDVHRQQQFEMFLGAHRETLPLVVQIRRRRTRRRDRRRGARRPTLATIAATRRAVDVLRAIRGIPQTADPRRRLRSSSSSSSTTTRRRRASRCSRAHPPLPSSSRRGPWANRSRRPEALLAARTAGATTRCGCAGG